MRKAVDLHLVVKNVLTLENLCQLCPSFIQFFYLQRCLLRMIEHRKSIAAFHNKY